MNNSAHKSTTLPDVVLASASPRRLELLKQLGWIPHVHSVDIDESVRIGEEATAYCKRMALEKNLTAQKRLNTELPIISADTIVVVNDEVLGKPEDQHMAMLTLVKLSGRTHQVYSAVSVSYQQQTATIISSNQVKMSNISEPQIAAYIATGEPMDKAGAYGIQGYAAMWIEQIQGSYSAIMGLPLFETTELLKQVGIMSPLELLNYS